MTYCWRTVYHLEKVAKYSISTKKCIIMSRICFKGIYIHFLLVVPCLLT